MSAFPAPQNDRFVVLRNPSVRPPSARALPRRRNKVTVSVGALEATQMAIFALFVGIAVHFAATLAGSIRVESSWRQRLASEDRATAARLTATELRREVDGLTSAVAVDAWAQAHGFVASLNSSGSQVSSETSTGK